MRLGLHHSRSISLLSLRNFFRSCAAIVLVSTGTHLMYVSLALRYRENAAINKEQMQTKYSDVINFYSIIASYCCLLDPPLHCPALYRPVLCFSPLDDEASALLFSFGWRGQCFAFLLWMMRSKIMEYISRYFCVLPLNNFGHELRWVVSYWSFYREDNRGY